MRPGRLGPALLVLAACPGASEPVRSTADAPTAPSSSTAAPSSPSAVAPSGAHRSDVFGAWRLVRIQSMDDRVFTPRADEMLTLELQPDGRALVVADCNRGRGSWRSSGPHQLQIGPIGLTRRACPSPSLGGRFVQDLGYVRTYVLRDGRLFLATLADGAILELAPEDEGDAAPNAPEP